MDPVPPHPATSPHPTPDLTGTEPQWVTLRSATEEGLPVVALVDEAVAAAAPYAVFTTQVAIAVQLAPTEDGQPSEADRERLRQIEQQLVDAGAQDGRLVAVLTLEGVREWVFYARATGWTTAIERAGLSVQVSDDPDWHGLRELSGRA